MVTGDVFVSRSWDRVCDEARRKRLSQLLNIGEEIWRSGSLMFYFFIFLFLFFFGPRPTVCDHMWGAEEEYLHLGRSPALSVRSSLRRTMSSLPALCTEYVPFSKFRRGSFLYVFCARWRCYYYCLLRWLWACLWSLCFFFFCVIASWLWQNFLKRQVGRAEQPRLYLPRRKRKGGAKKGPVRLPHLDKYGSMTKPERLTRLGSFPRSPKNTVPCSQRVFYRHCSVILR